MMNEHMLQEELEKLRYENHKLLQKLDKASQALNLIASPKRSDGTYNRCREACEQLARQTLKDINYEIY
jgi:hypothetical protein